MANSGVLRAILKAFGGLSLLLVILSLQGCIIYSKPAYSGRVIDAEDGTPIQGVSVEVEYYLNYQTIVEQNTYMLGSKKTKTDRNGYFEISSWTTLKSPFSWDNVVLFSFDKKSYINLSRKNIADCFSVGCEKRVFMSSDGRSVKLAISDNLLELSKLKSKQ